MKIRNANIEIRDKSKIQITKYYKLTTNYCFATENTKFFRLDNWIGFIN